MATRRLLIVDDSVVIRQALIAALSREPSLHAVGAASSGRVALMKIPLLHPDVVALDLDMPEMDGVETLTAIRQSYPRLPVILLAASTPQSSVAVVDALARGGTDYVLKPAGAVPTDAALRDLVGELISKIASCCPDVADLPMPPLQRGASNRIGASRGVTGRVDVLAIGVSTGGPVALMDLIPRFPADFPVPVLIVQHMPPVFTKLLAERLAAKARLPVAECPPCGTLAPPQVWIAPGDFHMAVEPEGDVVRIVRQKHPPENSCRPAVDVLFRSVARVYGSHALAVVMTGMGQDGLRGCESIQAAGGQVLAQDEPTSVVWGMPGFVARAGLADQVVPLSGLGDEILERVYRHRPIQWRTA